MTIIGPTFAKHVHDDKIVIGSNLSVASAALGGRHPVAKAAHITGIIPEEIHDFFLTRPRETLTGLLTTKDTRNLLKIDISGDAPVLLGDMKSALPQSAIKLFSAMGEQMALAANVGQTNLCIVEDIHRMIQSGEWHKDDPKQLGARELRGFMGISSFDPARELDYLPTSTLTDQDLSDILDRGNEKRIFVPLEKGSMTHVFCSSALYPGNIPDHAPRTTISIVSSRDALLFWSRPNELGSLKDDCLIHRTPPAKTSIPDGERRFSFLFQARQPLVA